MNLLPIVGFLATLVLNLKNSQGQSVVNNQIATVISAGESLVTGIVADIQAAQNSGASSPTAVAAYLQTIQGLLTVLSSEKVLSAQTASLITALGTALSAALQAEQTAQKQTDPSTLTPIPQAV